MSMCIFANLALLLKRRSKLALRRLLTAVSKTVVAMSNLKPVPDTVETLKPLLEKNQTDAKITVLQFAPITHDLHSDQVVDMAAT